MTADEIMGLLAAYGEDRFYQRFNGPGALALQLAIQRVVEERDALLKALGEGREVWAFIENEMQNEIIELRSERDDARVECERMSWRNP